MATSSNISIQAIMKLREENAKLQETLNFLRMENFEYSLKCNRMENILANIQVMSKNCPTKLIEASANLCGILQVCNPNNGPENEAPVPAENTVDKRSPPAKVARLSEKLTRSNKAHVVKPHMVNGHILYIPTINLTRVSDSHTKSNIVSTSKLPENNSTLERSATISDINQSSQEEGEEGMEFISTNTSQQFGDDQQQQISHSDEVSEASTSKSPSHSTVLSGTFQEVKIYLNPISQDKKRDEEVRKSSGSRPSPKKSKSPRRSKPGRPPRLRRSRKS